MHICCCCHRMKVMTGSEVYFFELCSALVELGHKVTLAAPEISVFYKEKCHKAGFELVPIFELNDGYDLILMSHYKSFEQFIPKNTPIINIIHSEIYDLEQPYNSDQVIKYIGVRDTICQKLINEYHINPEKVQMIRNPIDLSKFNTHNCQDSKYGLFVGTMGGLRYKPAIHFAEFCKVNKLTSVYIGPENESLPFFDKVFPATESIEVYFKNCSVSGGIIQGRTYFEAKLCGKKTIEYYINRMGMLDYIEYEDEPSSVELKMLQDTFDRKRVAERIISTTRS